MMAEDSMLFLAQDAARDQAEICHKFLPLPGKSRLADRATGTAQRDGHGARRHVAFTEPVITGAKDSAENAVARGLFPWLPIDPHSIAFADLTSDFGKSEYIRSIPLRHSSSP